MFLAGTARLMFAWGLVHRCGEASVSAATAPAAGDHKSVVGLGKLENLIGGFVVVDNRSYRDFQNHVTTVPAGFVRTFAMAPALGFVLWIEAEVHQRVVALAGFHDDVATLTAVAAGRSAARNELLPPEGHAAIAPVPGLDSNFGLIDKHGFTTNSYVVREHRPAENVCHPEQSEGPGFLPTPPDLPLQANTEIPRVARDDNS